MPQTPLDALESQSIYILREAFNRFDRLARKAFSGRVRYPVVHVGTGKKIAEICPCRDLACASNATTVDGIIAEPETTGVSGRAGRRMDPETENAFERLRGDGDH